MIPRTIENVPISAIRLIKMRIIQYRPVAPVTEPMIAHDRCWLVAGLLFTDRQGSQNVHTLSNN